MGNPALAPEEHYTYRHYKTWPDSERWELIDGQAWAMSPAPKTRHQGISGRFFASLYRFLEGKPCQVFAAPFDVLLPEGDEPDDEVGSVVQPDIVVYCDHAKLTEAAPEEPPILSSRYSRPRPPRRTITTSSSSTKGMEYGSTGSSIPRAGGSASIGYRRMAPLTRASSASGCATTDLSRRRSSMASSWTARCSSPTWTSRRTPPAVKLVWRCLRNLGREVLEMAMRILYSIM
jgi:hypothetical protein